MKIAVLSDIHGNHVAFRKSIEYIEEQNINHCILLGDYIGEFPYPQKTMELLYYLKETKECIFISGNKEDYWKWYRECGETGWQDYHSVTGCMYYGYHNLISEDINFMLGISAMLQFLASPLIGCVERSKEGYSAVGTLEDAAQKFDFYSRMCKNQK